MIKFLVMDVDGTLTDGKIYMGADGELLKAFDVKDGCGIKELLPKYGIVPVIITARTSSILKNRCAELGISELHQGVSNKMDCLTEIMSHLGACLSDVAYIGDDILDLQCMVPIAQNGGLTGCPADAVAPVVAVSSYIAPHKAGDGAVRDFIEYIIANHQSTNISIDERVNKALVYINTLVADSLDIGRHDVSPDFYYNVIEYVPGEEKNTPYESHRKYIDIQRVISGEEWLMIADISRLSPITQYDIDRDFINYYASDNRSGILLRPGSCVILFPKDAHKATRIGQNTTKVKKIVGKLRINNE